MFEVFWDAMMFRPYFGPVDAEVIIMGVMAWILALMLAFVAACFALWLIYTIYRLIAYDYENATMPAWVTKKKFKPEHSTWTYNAALKTPTRTTHSAEYNIYITTDDDLDDIINDKKLYQHVGIGSQIEVTMKIGRSRGGDREIKYWRVIDYSWH